MSKLKQLFERKSKNIFSVYFTAGYPALEDTVPIIKALESRGVDLIEVGIPFSDPMADGPVIQQSSTAALQNGMTLRKLFAQLDGIREQTQIPLVMMGYLNPILQYGIEAFFADCNARGIDGMIIPDLPFREYLNQFKPLAEKYGIPVIMLITPETSEDRIRQIDQQTDGFIYMVSTASTTGAKESFDGQTSAYFDRIDRMNLRNPRLIGFGISNHTTLHAAFSRANGAIIGSEFIRLLGIEARVEEAVDALICKLQTKKEL